MRTRLAAAMLALALGALDTGLRATTADTDTGWRSLFDGFVRVP